MGNTGTTGTSRVLIDFQPVEVVRGAQRQNLGAKFGYFTSSNEAQIAHPAR